MDELRLIARQCGLITRQQAISGGLSSAAVGRRIRSGEWQPVLPGVYRHIAAALDDELMVHAAVLWLGPAAVLSGSWAAWWHGLRSEPEGPVLMTVRRAAAGARQRYVKTRRRDLAEVDIVVIRGVRVLCRALTALENAGLPNGQDCFDRALQRHLSVAELSETMERFANATGCRAARAALELARDGTVSPPERELAAALRRCGLTQIAAGVHIELAGRRVWLDFAVAELKLAIEVDGVSAHTEPAQFHADRERQNALITHGWTVLRYTPQQIRRDLAGTVTEIAQVLATIGEDSAR